MFSVVGGNFNNSIVQHVLVYFSSTKNTIIAIIIKTVLVSYCYKRGFCEVFSIVLKHAANEHKNNYGLLVLSIVVRSNILYIQSSSVVYLTYEL